MQNYDAPNYFRANVLPQISTMIGPLGYNKDTREGVRTQHCYQTMSTTVFFRLSMSSDQSLISSASFNGMPSSRSVLLFQDSQFDCNWLTSP